MINPPAIDDPRPVFHVEHLVIHDERYQIFRNLRIIERAADDDCLVDIIVMTEDSFGPAGAPAESRFGQLIVKILAIEPGKELVKIVGESVGSGEALSTALLSCQIRGSQHLRLVCILPVKFDVLGTGALIVEF